MNVDIQLSLTLPVNAKGPVPVVMQFAYSFPAGRAMPGRGAPGAAGGRAPAGPTWQQQVLDKGWGYATIIPTSIQADNGAGLRQGIIGLCNKGETRKADDWGALRAWGWGASRALDYFETLKTVDAKHVAIEGHSRYGKATLVATRCLALALTAGVLTSSYSLVGTKPLAADRAGSFSGRGHRES